LRMVRRIIQIRNTSTVFSLRNAPLLRPNIPTLLIRQYPPWPSQRFYLVSPAEFQPLLCLLPPSPYRSTASPTLYYALPRTPPHMLYALNLAVLPRYMPIPRQHVRVILRSPSTSFVIPIIFRCSYYRHPFCSLVFLHAPRSLYSVHVR